jgi:hypothetical protein
MAPRLKLWWRGAFGAALLALVGCTMSSSAELPATVGLGDADVAVYITKFTNEGTDGGRVVLYDRAGPVSMVTNTGIMHPGLIWDDAGLFFVDQKTDFEVSDRVERNVRSRAADVLVGMHAGADGRRVVLFNDGVFGGHDHTGIGAYSGVHELSQTTFLDGTAESFAACGGKNLAAGRTMRPRGSSELVDLTAAGGPVRVGSLVAGDFLAGASTPCLGERVVGLWRPNNDEISSYPLEIWQWSAVDGSVKRIKLVTATGDFIASDKSTDSSSMLPRWVDGESLFWIDSLGVAWRSNLKTGLTVKLRDGLPVVDTPTDGWVKSGDWVIQFEYSPDHSSAHLLVYSAKDLSLVETRELPRLAELSPGDQMVLAVAVRPGFTPGK